MGVRETLREPAILSIEVFPAKWIDRSDLGVEATTGHSGTDRVTDRVHAGRGQVPAAQGRRGDHRPLLFPDFYS
jgi:hypothetical protein